MNYDARRQLNSLLNKRKFDSTSDDQLSKKIQDFTKTKELLEKRCKQEEYYSMKSKFKQVVRYGYEVELVHQLSGRIVTVCKSSRSNYFLELKETGRPDKCNFKIMPRYKYRTEGDKVMLGDYFVLYNESANLYMYISDNEIKKTEIHEKPPTYRPQVSFRRIPNSALHSKNTIELRQRNGSRMQVVPFWHSSDEKDRFIKGGDIIRIRHLGIDAHIQSMPNGNECSLVRYRGTDVLEEKDSNSLFEIEINCDEERGRYVYWNEAKDDSDEAETTDLLGLDSNEIDQNEEKISSVFKLRHVNSGLHLTVKKKGDKHQLWLAEPQDLNDKDNIKQYVDQMLFTLESQSVDPDK